MEAAKCMYCNEWFVDEDKYKKQLERDAERSRETDKENTKGGHTETAPGGAIAATGCLGIIFVAVFAALFGLLPLSAVTISVVACVLALIGIGAAVVLRDQNSEK